MIVEGSKVHWHTEPELKGIVLSMSRWRRLAIIEVTNSPSYSTVKPGLIIPVHTESLREYAAESN